MDSSNNTHDTDNKIINSIFIEKDTIKRIIKDVKEVNKNKLSDNGIYYIHDETNVLKGYALIIGPKDTVYSYGYYFFEIDFPNNYPFSPPKFIYQTNGYKIRFHPNMYRSGKVCLSLLNTWRGEQWTSCSSLKSILLTLSSIMDEIPLLNEPGITKNHPEVNKYNQVIKYGNLICAIIDVCNFKPHFERFIHLFKDVIIETFNKNYNDILDNYNHLFSLKSYEICTIYNMKITIDYKNSKSQLYDIKCLFNNKNEI